MRDLNIGCTAEIGDRARDFEQAIVGAGRQAELLDGGAEKGFDLITRCAVGAELAAGVLGTIERKTVLTTTD